MIEVYGRTRIWPVFDRKGVMIECINDRILDDEKDSCRSLRLELPLAIVDYGLWPTCLLVEGFSEEILAQPSGKCYRDPEGRNRYVPPPLPDWRPGIVKVRIFNER